MKIPRLLLIIFTLQAITAVAQQLEVKSYTLTQAIEFARKNNPSVQSARLDEKMAQEQIKETWSQGLPQINADGRFTYTPQIPNVGIKNPGFFGPEPVVAFPQGIDYSIGTNLNASQLLFDGSFLMGLKAAREFSMLSKYNSKRSEQQMELDITRAYCMVLVTEESLKLIDQNILTLSKTRNDLEATYKAGFAEKVDYDRIQLAYSNLLITRRQVEEGRQLSYYALKMQMGLPVKDSITLTDGLEKIYEESNKQPEPALTSDFRNRPEMQILEQQKRLYELDKKRHAAGYLPSVSAFAQHQQNAFHTDFGSVFNTFYPGTMVGLNLRVPLFDGFYKNTKMQQARINLQKTELNMSQMESAIETEVYSNKTKYFRSKEQLQLQKQNLELAEDIYKRVQVKFQNGLSSSLDLLTAEKDLKESQKNYLDAIYDVLISRAELKKSTGQ